MRNLTQDTLCEANLLNLLKCTAPRGRAEPYNDAVLIHSIFTLLQAIDDDSNQVNFPVD